MYSVAKFHARSGRMGTPLNHPFPSFELERVVFRYGATSMIAGKPGSFKSVLALNILTRWTQAGYSAVYFAADSDEEEMAERLASIGTGVAAEKVEADFNARNIKPYLPALAEFSSRVRFEYKALDMDGIADRLNAYETVYGSFPDVVFIDNLINFAPTTDDWGFMRDMTSELAKLAQATHCHICVLHHASEGYGHSCDPVPRAAIQGKISQIPRLILTVAANGRALAVSCVKNRHGMQYPDATHFMTFHVADSLQVTDDYRELL